MKQIRYYQTIMFLSLACCALSLFRCAMRDGDPQLRTNPYDINGEGFKFDKNPEITAAPDNSPLWVDYNFISNTGTLAFKFSVSDSNLPYDTLTNYMLAGTSLDSLDTIAVGNDSLFEISGINLSQKVYYKIIVMDKFDSSAVLIDSVTAPVGTPPHPPATITVSTPYSSSISLSWSAVTDAATYSIYRSDSTGTPFHKLDSQSSAYTRSYYDYTGDYRMHQYLLASGNQYGDARSTDTGIGWVTYSYLPTPSLTVYDQNSSEYIRLGWYIYSSSYSINSFRILRSASSSGPWILVATVPYIQHSDFYYNDTSVPSTMYYYYRVAAFDAQGRGGELSYSEGGSLWQISPPSSISASDGSYTNYISVSWYSASQASGYYIYRSTSSSGPYVKIDSTTGSVYRDSSIDSTVNFYYKVSSYDGRKNESSLSASYDFGYLSRLSAPYSLSVSAGTYDNYIQLSWYAVSGAAGYYIFRGSSANGPFIRIDSTAAILYADSSADSTIDYYYMVSAYNSSHKEGTRTSPSYGYIKRLPAPSSVSASDGASMVYIDVSWLAVTGAKGYSIYRSSSSNGTYTKVGSTTSTSYRDTVTTSGVVYYYKIAGYDSLGRDGTLSYSTSGYINSPATVSGISISNGLYPGCIKLTWTALSDNLPVRIYRASGTSVSTFLVLDTANTNSYTDSAVSGDSTYYYRLSVFIGQNEGSLSSASLGRSMYPAVAFAVAPLPACAQISWIVPSYATAQQLYRATDADSPFVKLADLATSINQYRDSLADFASYWYRLSASNANGTGPFTIALKAGRVPAAPASFTSVDTINGTRLVWSRVAGASQYYIVKSVYPNSTSSYILLDSIADTVYQISDSSFNRYYYKISGRNANGSGAETSPIIAGKIMVPAIPQSLQAVGTPEFVRVSWTSNPAGSNATLYYIYRSTTQAGTFAKTDSSTSTFYNDSIPDTTGYYYKVSAFNSLGESDVTGAVYGKRTVPAAPAALNATMSTYGSHVGLSWHSTTGAGGYIIYRSSLYAGTYSVLDSTADTLYDDSAALIPGTNYYKVSAYNDIGMSIQSNILSGAKLLAPENVSAVGSASHITISWNASQNALGYFIYRSTSSSGLFTRLDSTETLTYYDTVPGSSMYYYRVSAYRLDESLPSTATNGTQRLLPSVPSLISASQGTITDTVRLVWHKSNGADGYRVYRAADSAFTSPVLRVTTTDTGCVDTVSSDALFFYKVKAFNTAGESVLGNLMSGFRLPSVAPNAPANLGATDSITGYIRLAWNRPATGTPVNGYKIYRSTTQTGTYSLIDSTIQMSYIDYVPLSYPTYYWYKVTAYNLTGEGVRSTAASGTRR